MNLKISAAKRLITINPFQNKSFCLHIIWVCTFTFIFSHLADAFYPKRLTNEDNGSNQNQQKSNNMQVL